jgi:pimeloyl-ACP methyl ester carboxylesterase
VRGLGLSGFLLTRREAFRGWAEHLYEIKIPMLFLQRARDKLAELPLVERLATTLGRGARLHLFEHADHSFHVPAKSGSNDREVMREMLDVLSGWIEELV